MDDLTDREDHENVSQHLKQSSLETSASNEYGSDGDLKRFFTSLNKEEFREKCRPSWAVTVEDSKIECDVFQKLLSKLTVSVNVLNITPGRKKINLSSKAVNTVSKNLTQKNYHEIYEIGKIFEVSKSENSGQMERCHCKKCQHSEKPSKDWGKVMILMARCVNNKNNEPTITSCEILGEIPVTLNDVVWRKCNDDDDWQELECVTCDIGLLANLDEIIKQCSTLLKNLRGNLKKIKEKERNEASPFLPYKKGSLIYESDVEEKELGKHNDLSFQSHGLFWNCFSSERVFILISSVSLLLAITALILVCVKISKTEDHSTNVSFATENECLSCTSSSLSGSIDEIMKFLMESNRSTQSPQQNPSHTKSHTPASAHLYLREPPKISGTDGYDGPNFSNKDHVDAYLQIPTGHSSAGQHARGVNVGETGIYILYSGLYYIYSGVSFKTNTSKSSTEFAYQNWFHYVHRLSPNSPMNSGVLLRNVYTSCPSCYNIGESGFTGGIFNLQAGDKIQVCFSGQGFIDYQSNTSFLGLFMLSSPQDHHLDVGV